MFLFFFNVWLMGGRHVWKGLFVHISFFFSLAVLLKRRKISIHFKDVCYGNSCLHSRAKASIPHIFLFNPWNHGEGVCLHSVVKLTKPIMNKVFLLLVKYFFLQKTDLMLSISDMFSRFYEENSKMCFLGVLLVWNNRKLWKILWWQLKLPLGNCLRSGLNLSFWDCVNRERLVLEPSWTLTL